MVIGVARVPIPGDKTIFAPSQQKMQSLKRKVGAEAKYYICCLLLLFIFRSNKTDLDLKR